MPEVGDAAPQRYVTDIPYLPSYIAEIAPEWLDLVALVGGHAPPARADGFSWCELGCGRGLTPIILAAGRSEGRFVGIDLMPGHIATANRVARTAGIGNVAFHACDFTDAFALDLQRFDYIVAHGVYSWIDEAAQAALCAFVDHHLAPGGLVYISYNAMPGWAADMPFRHLANAFAATEPGASDARFTAAAARIGALTDAGAAALTAGTMARRLRRDMDAQPLAYYAHEYLSPAWRPLYVTEVRSAMAEIGLAPLGSATLADNFDTLVLRASARDALRAIADPDLRELSRDYFLNQRFRRDVFGRDVPRIADKVRTERLLGQTITLALPRTLVEFTMRTEAGEVRFDNPAARTLIDCLARGPRVAGACRDPATSDRDLVANLLTLAAAAVIVPVPPSLISPDALNRALAAEADTGGTTLHVRPAGNAVRVYRSDTAAGSPAEEAARCAWSEFLGLEATGPR